MVQQEHIHYNINTIVIIVLFILVLTVWQDKPILINAHQLK